MKRLAAVLAAIAACLVSFSLAAQSGSGGVNRPEHIGKPYVILVSVDGLKPEYLDRFTLPNFQRVIKRGARARGMIPVFPTLTFPNHYSLVTGLRPARHGIVFNRFWDPARGQTYALGEEQSVTDGTWYGGEPIWVTAETQGMVAACFYWPGSEAAIKGVRPSLHRKYLQAMPNSERVAAVLEWLRLPAASRPHLLTLYFSTLDSASHGGPLDAPGVEKAAREVDAVIGELLDGIAALPIARDINLLITSDHGMVDTTRAQIVDIETIADMSGVIAFFGGPVTAVHIADAARASQLRDQVNARLTHGRAYLRGDLPERFYLRDNPRAGNVVVIMDEGWTLERGRGRKRVEEWGQHGWDNILPSMRATFIAMGPTIRAGLTIDEVENIDVYPFMAELLGLQAATGIDGRPGRIRSLIAR
ncbi:MAG: ectonucleotide pyrophosphatase/phosphodiesterase [Vicinamibacterales bacterium]